MFRLLEEEPDLRLALRDRLLTESQLAVEAAVQELAASQRTTGEHLATLAGRVDGLAEQLVTLTGRVDAIAAAMETLTRRVDAMAKQAKQMGKLADWVGELRGEAFERRYREQASTRFAPIARRLRLLTGQALDDLLDDAVDAGTLTEDEAHEVRLADAVVRGRRRDDGAEVVLVAEVSAGVRISDVQRAAESARILATLARPTLPVVAEEWVTPQAAEAARALGVWQVSAAGVEPPPQPPTAAAS